MRSIECLISGESNSREDIKQKPINDETSFPFDLTNVFSQVFMFSDFLLICMIVQINTVQSV